jgi:hypothetical protein
LINSCVSSELRNPLNSLVAYNALKKKIVERIEYVVSTCINNDKDNLGVPAELRLQILRDQV